MSRDSIKMVAMLTMLINHIANVFLPAGQVWEAVGCAVPILVSAFVILYLYKKSKSLISMGMPMSVLKEDKIFDKVIAMKYDIPNDKPELFEQYKKDIDAFYEDVIERNA